MIALLLVWLTDCRVSPADDRLPDCWRLFHRRPYTRLFLAWLPRHWAQERWQEHPSHSWQPRRICPGSFFSVQMCWCLQVCRSIQVFLYPSPTFLKFLMKILGRFLILGRTVFDNIWESHLPWQTFQSCFPVFCTVCLQLATCSSSMILSVFISRLKDDRQRFCTF